MDPQQTPQQPQQQYPPQAPQQGEYSLPQQPQQAPMAPQPMPAQANPYAQPQQMPPQAAPGQPVYPQAPAANYAPQQQAPQVIDARKNTNPNSTQNTLQIAEIRDGVVIMNDGSFRSVVMTKSINFDLMSPDEREAVEYAYQGFLNSLYFPIQIFIRSQKIDIRPYIERLDRLRTEQENMLLALMMEDYIEFIQVLAEETNIMDKQFYIVIPYSSQIDGQIALDRSKKLFDLFKKDERQTVTINEADLQKAQGELKNRIQLVMSGLQQVGVQSIPLDTQELIELYYDSYNPDTATRQKIKNFPDLTAEVVTKGAGEANNPQLDREME